MLVVAGLMFRHRHAAGDPTARLGRENAPRLLASGLAQNLASDLSPRRWASGSKASSLAE